MPTTFELAEYVEDVIGSEREAWEYFMKLKYFSADLYIAEMISISTTDRIKEWERRAIKDFGRDFTHVVVDLGRMEPLPAFARDSSGKLQERELKVECLHFGMHDCDFLLPLNFAPIPISATSMDTMVHRAVIFKIVMGRSMTYTSNKMASLPDHLDSVVYQTDVQQIDPDVSQMFEQVKAVDRPFFYDEKTHLQSKNKAVSTALTNQCWVRLKLPEVQAIPVYLCTVDFRPVRVETSMPVCDACSVSSATVYCSADKSHFCSSCDVAHHSRSTVVARHVRCSVTESPHMFGNCSEHPSAVIDAVCEGCFQTLCSYCLLLGNHALVANPREHPLVSTFEAYKHCLSGDSDVDQTLRAMRANIGKKMDHLQFGLTQSIRNFKSIAKQLEEVKRETVHKIDSLYSNARLRYLEGIRKEFVMELLFWKLVEDFWSHVSKTLPPAMYLHYRRKLSRLVHIWASSDMASYAGDTVTSFPPSLYQAPTSVHLPSLFPSWWSSSGQNGVDPTQVAGDNDGAQRKKFNASTLVPAIIVEGSLVVSPINKDAWIGNEVFGPTAHELDDDLVMDSWEKTCENVLPSPTITDNVAVLGEIAGHDDVADDGDRYLINQAELEVKSPDEVMKQSTHIPKCKIIWQVLSDHEFQLLRKLLYAPDSELSFSVKMELADAVVDLALYFGDVTNVLTILFCQTYIRMFRRCARAPFMDYDTFRQSTLDCDLLVDPLLGECISHVLDGNPALGNNFGGMLSNDDASSLIATIIPFLQSLASKITVSDLKEENDQKTPTLDPSLDARLNGSFESSQEVVGDLTEESFRKLSDYDEWCVDDETMNFIKALTSKLTTLSKLPVYVQAIICIAHQSYDHLLDLSRLGLLQTVDAMWSADEPCRFHNLPSQLNQRAPAGVAVLCILSYIYSKAILAVGRRLEKEAEDRGDRLRLSLAARCLAQRLHGIGFHAFVECLHYVDKSRRRRDLELLVGTDLGTQLDTELGAGEEGSVYMRAGHATARWMLHSVARNLRGDDSKVINPPLQFRGSDVDRINVIRHAGDVWIEAAPHFEQAKDNMEFYSCTLSSQDREGLQKLIRLANLEPSAEDTNPAQDNIVPTGKVDEVPTGPDMV
ncbi:putative zinc finger protein [Gregarina niphandrodes]|uniref:Zinc finger protein n=1 Tax=Gregarina niphandrodes TaxID=110365 RepID=A0A023B7N5_GRENI|nr:putative zinc finger protein [Gregarina niphandrodes]EZG67543.1 putative zinc finger protein [Gregarina niphandrodes]|eukprot:XP_011130204.1 putative zinc finger protein [Gregarina niphandrodes]